MIPTIMWGDEPAFKEEFEELKKEVARLSVCKFAGIVNKCSNCKKTGQFGAISQYTCKNGTKFRICGWCNHIEKLEEDNADNNRHEQRAK